MTERYISGQPEGWAETDEGHRTIYAMDPNLIPASQVARVIYELRLDVNRLNTEAIVAQRLNAKAQLVAELQAQPKGYDYAPIYAALSDWDKEDQPTSEQIDAIIAAFQAQQAQPVDQPEERTWTFTISANFTAATKQEAWDEWVDWLTNPGNLEDGTQVTELLDEGQPEAVQVFGPGGLLEKHWANEGFPDCRECGKFGYHTRKAGCIIATERAAAVNGTEGQDRESYTDTQDRKSYTTTAYSVWEAQSFKGFTNLSYEDWAASFGLDPS